MHLRVEELHLYFYLNNFIFAVFLFMPGMWLNTIGYNNFMCKYNYFSCYSKKNVSKY